MTTETKSLDRIKLPFSFDADKMMADINALQLGNFEYYSALPLRAPAHLIDASRPFPPPATNYADGSWTEWLDSKKLTSSPYLKTVVDSFAAHTKVTLVRLLRLAAKSEVKEHTDPTLGLEIEESVIRLTIPILSDETVSFYLNGTLVPMKPGECWYLRLTDPHRVLNLGEQERINMTIDMLPNEWIRGIIEDSITQ